MGIRGPVMLAAMGALLAGSCTTTPVQEVQSPKAQRELADALAGRTPGPPQRCILSHQSDQMQVIDDYTILFRDGRTVYLQRPHGGCTGLANGGRTLLTRKFGTTDTCDGDINHLVDLPSGMQAGSCVFGPFVPYTRL